MSSCPKCGKDVNPPATVCADCGAVVDEAAGPSPAGAASAPEVPVELLLRAAALPTAPPTPGQRALAGAKGGALMGALYGAVYGLILWIGLTAISAQMEDKYAELGKIVLAYGVMGAVALGALGAVFRLLVPPKPKVPPTSPKEKSDTKIDKS